MLLPVTVYETDVACCGFVEVRGGNGWVVAQPRASRPYMPGCGVRPIDFRDPDVNATIGVRPVWVFGLSEDDFTGSPTRWTFADTAPRSDGA